MANKKDLILRSGFTNRELLAMKNNFYAMRRWYRLERKPIPESEPKDLTEYILSIANRSFFTPFIIFIIGFIQTTGIYFMYHSIGSTMLMVFISLFALFCGMHITAKSENTKLITTSKLFALHISIKLEQVKKYFKRS